MCTRLSALQRLEIIRIVDVSNDGRIIKRPFDRAGMMAQDAARAGIALQGPEHIFERSRQHDRIPAPSLEGWDQGHGSAVLLPCRR